MKTIAFLFFLFLPVMVFAVEDTIPRKYYLNVGVNLNILPVMVSSYIFYEGERYVSGSAPAQFIWVKNDTSRNNYLDNHKFRANAFQVGFSPVKEFSISLNYQAITIGRASNYQTLQDEVLRSEFFIVAGSAQYDKYFRRLPGVFFSVGGSAGSYIGNESNSGPGQEYYYGLIAGFGKRNPNDRVTAQLAYNQAFMRYKHTIENGYIPGKQTELKNWNVGFIGFKILYHFQMIPD